MTFLFIIDELDQKLRKQRRELLACTAKDAKSLLPFNQEALERCNEQIAACTAKESELDHSVEDLTSKVSTLTNQIEQAQISVDAATRETELCQRAATRHATRRQALLIRKEDCARRILELAVIPDELLVNQFREAPSDRILKHMHGLTERLKTLGPINKKASEQYSTFTKQGEQLMTRQTDLDSSAIVTCTNF